MRHASLKERQDCCAAKIVDLCAAAESAGTATLPLRANFQRAMREAVLIALGQSEQIRNYYSVCVHPCPFRLRQPETHEHLDFETRDIHARETTVHADNDANDHARVRSHVFPPHEMR